MNPGDQQSKSEDNDILRQREIESQIGSLHSPVAHVRVNAVRRLGDLQAGIDELINCLQDPAESVRSAAASSLGRYALDERRLEVIDILLSAIDDPSERVCQTAIRSLGLLKAETARAEIEPFLAESNPYILGSTILALARIGAFELAPQLAEYLTHESDYVKTQAVRAMGLFKYIPARQTIVSALKAGRESCNTEGFIDPAIRKDRRESDLYNLQIQLIRVAGDLQATEAVPILMEIALKDIGFRGLAVEALAAIGADIDPQFLTGLLADPSVFLRRRLIQLVIRYQYLPALPLLRPLLHEENVTIRAATLESVVQLKDIESFPRIIWMCYHDPNPFIRVQAVHSLAVLRGQAAVQELIGLACDANYQVCRTAVSYLLEWNQQDRQVLDVFALFVNAYPDDIFTPAIQSIFSQQGYSTGNYRHTQQTNLPLVPDFLIEEAESILSRLTCWQEELLRQPSPERQAVSSALVLLIDVLSRR